MTKKGNEKEYYAEYRLKNREKMNERNKLFMRKFRARKKEIIEKSIEQLKVAQDEHQTKNGK